MVRNLVWVIGEGGMLGSHLVSTLSAHEYKIFSPHLKFNWGDNDEVICQIKNIFDNFIIEASKFGGWIIFWAAGKSNMLASNSEVAIENEIFEFLVQHLVRQKNLPPNGIFAIASSAGAIYADSQIPIVSETSAVYPNTPYAIGKLKQENLIINLSRRNPLISSAIFRISTLYGIRPNNLNSQGLINVMAKKIHNHEEIKFFVPLSTRRDYIHVEDASLLIAKVLKNIGTKPGTFMKIVSSEKTYSIEELIDIFRRKIEYPIKFNCTLNEFSFSYSKNIEFRSNTFRDVEDIKIRALEEGVENLLRQLSPE